MPWPAEMAFLHRHRGHPYLGPLSVRHVAIQQNSSVLCHLRFNKVISCIVHWFSSSLSAWFLCPFTLLLDLEYHITCFCLTQKQNPPACKHLSPNAELSLLSRGWGRTPPWTLDSFCPSVLSVAHKHHEQKQRGGGGGYFVLQVIVHVKSSQGKTSLGMLLTGSLPWS